MQAEEGDEEEGCSSRRESLILWRKRRPKEREREHFDIDISSTKSREPRHHQNVGNGIQLLKAIRRKHKLILRHAKTASKTPSSLELHSPPPSPFPGIQNVCGLYTVRYGVATHNIS